MDSEEISPQAIYGATQKDSNLVDMKAKYNFTNFFGKNKKEEDENDFEDKNIKDILIPALEEDVQLSDYSQEQEYLEDLIYEQNN